MTPQGTIPHNAHILVVGVGRLGTRTAQLLCDAGCKRITLCDYDIVTEENLAEQPLYTQEDIGHGKAATATRHLKKRYPNASINALPVMFSPEVLTDDVSIIIDGTDNLETRLVLNDVANAKNVPLIIATATKSRGMVFAVQQDRPCWQCITKGKVSGDDCASGIESQVADAVAKAQAALAQKILTGERVASDLQLIDEHRTAHITVRTNPACAACKGHYDYLNIPFSISYCGSHERVIARPNTPRVLELETLREKERVLHDYGQAILIALDNGTALVHRHGLIEFSDVDSAAAQAFAMRVLRVRSASK